MKTKLPKTVLFLLFLLTTETTFSQNEYFQHDPSWQLDNKLYFGGGVCTKTYQSNYYVKGDTLIDSLRYYQVFQKSKGTLTWNGGLPAPINCSGAFVRIDTEPSFFVRSLDRKMFLRFLPDTAEQLLYNFNLAVGDTLPMTYNNSFNDITVTAIDSIYTPFGYRQRFTLGGITWSQYLIEGMGHSRGLIEPMKSSTDYDFDLKCYGLGDSSFFPALGGSCDLAIGINDVKKEIPLSVFPNPFSTTITFEFKNSEPNTVLKIYTVYGQEVKTSQSFSGRKIILNRGNLASGIYFYEFKQGNNSKTLGKLIIED